MWFKVRVKDMMRYGMITQNPKKLNANLCKIHNTHYIIIILHNAEEKNDKPNNGYNR